MSGYHGFIQDILTLAHSLPSKQANEIIAGKNIDNIINTIDDQFMQPKHRIKRLIKAADIIRLNIAYASNGKLSLSNNFLLHAQAEMLASRVSNIYQYLPWAHVPKEEQEHYEQLITLLREDTSSYPRMINDYKEHGLSTMIKETMRKELVRRAI